MIEDFNHFFWIFFIDSGKVLKAVVKADSSEFSNGPSSIPNVISQSWEVFPKQSVKSVHLVNHTRLVVLTENEMSVISVTNCDSFSSCIKCVSLRDPHCGWDKNEHKCVPKDTQSTSEDENFIQSVSKGDIQKCPFGKSILKKIFKYCFCGFWFIL